jgi:deoxyribonuclease-4
MPVSIAREQDVLKLPIPKRPPRLTSRRIGIHTSTAGGVHNAAERAYRLGCNTFQIFSSSPRQWAPYALSRPQCDELARLREKYDLKPMAIHVNYLVNLASTTPLFLKSRSRHFVVKWNERSPCSRIIWCSTQAHSVAPTGKRV